MAESEIAIPIAVGLAAVGLALLDRGYLSYRNAKKSDPSLKFSFEYIVTIIIAAGGAGGFFGLILPIIQATITAPIEGYFTIWAMVQFVTAYFSTVGLLDKLNQTLEAKNETAKVKAAVASGDIKIENKKEGEPF
jgi:hypothetical protein